MNFQSVLPSPPLQDVVERYWIAEASVAPGQAVELPVSAGVHHAIIFCCKVPHRVRYANGLFSSLPKCFLSGHLTQSAVNIITEPSALFGIDLKHTVLYKLLGIPPERLTDDFIDIEVALGQAGKWFREQLAQAHCFEERIAVAESFLVNYLSEIKLKIDHSEHAIDMIMQHAGHVSITAICKALQISERHLLRSFTEEVGISPKLYARIVRFNRASRHLENSPQMKIQDIIHQFGYFDQSHFIKDFVQFTGKNPAEYFKSHPDFNKYYFKE